MKWPSKKEPAATPRRRVAQDADVSFESESTSSQFRRNQTLSSYRPTPTNDVSSRQQAHQLATQRRKLGGIFLIVFIVVVVLLFLLWQLIAQVRVTTSSTQLARSFESAQYEQAIGEYLGMNPAQRLRLSLNEADLSRYVAGRLPEVESVRLQPAIGLAQGSFAITFRTPLAGWQFDGRQNYVDSQGVVFEENYYTAPSVQIVDESGIAPEQGTAVAGTRLLGFLGRIVAQAGERGYVVTQAVLPAETTRQVDVLVADRPTRIKLSIDRGAGEQAEDLDRVLRYLDAQNRQPEYIDVRVEGRAAYR